VQEDQHSSLLVTLAVDDCGTEAHCTTAHIVN